MTNQQKLLSAFKEDRFEDFRELLLCKDIDVDYFYRDPDSGRLLEFAIRSPEYKHKKYIPKLIGTGAKVWRKVEKTGELWLLYIFNTANKDFFHEIWSRVYGSSRSGNGSASVIQVAVEKNDIEAISILARSYSIIRDRLTYNNYYPEPQQPLILLRGSIHAVRLFIKYFEVEKEFQKDCQGRILSCRDVILQKYPELESELPTLLPNELQEILFLYLEKGASESFVRRIADITSTEILNEGKQKNSSMTYLHVACERNYIDVVDALLKKTIVHLNELVLYSDEFPRKVTPIMLAAFKGHYEIFDKLFILSEVELQTAGGSGSVLHSVLHGMQAMQISSFSTTDCHHMILESLLDVTESSHLYTRLNIEHTDESNKTALQYALKYNNKLAIKLLLRAGAKLYEMDHSKLQEHLFLNLQNGDTESFVKQVAFISTEILNDGRERNNNFTYLHLACERNYIDVVDALLKKKNIHLNELVLYFNEFTLNVTPIMLAAFNGHYEVFNKLFILSKVELQTAEGSGSVLHSVLHGMQAMQNRNCSTDGHRMILESLLEVTESGHLYTRLNIEHTDEYNRTALHYALKYNNKLAIELLLRAGAKLYRMDHSVLQEHLFLNLNKGDTESFVKRIADINIKILNDGRERYNKFTYLHVACERNYIDVVDALLEKEIVHLNLPVLYFNEFTQYVTPIMLAAFNGHYEVFKKLFIQRNVKLQTAEGSGSVLHSVLHGMRAMQNRNCSTDCHCKILELLLRVKDSNQRTPLNIEHTDKNNNTGLHYALKFNNEFAIKLLLKAGAKLYVKDRSILTWISARIIEGCLDDCIRSNREFSYTQDPKERSIIFKYKIFTQLDLYSIATKRKKNIFTRFEPLTQLRKLYMHPLMKSLLFLKWRLVRKYYYINFAFYLSFCLALSTYIFQIQHCLPSSDNFNGSVPADTESNHNASSVLCDASSWMWLITLPLYVTLILRELCQFSVSIREYVGIPENWFEITMIVVIGFLFANNTNTHLAATAILMSWIGLILVLGKQPSLSIYIEMFKTVALNFAKFLLLYSILIASFAYSFFILFRNKTSGHASSQNLTNVNATEPSNENSINSWRDLQMSFIRSIIMMTGEFEASTLPLESNFGYGHVFFILFVFLVSMVLYNLLNGLAVSDTRGIMEDAKLVALISRAKLISQIERLAKSNPFRNVFYCRITNQLENVYLFLRDKLFSDRIRLDEMKRVYVYPTKNNRIEIYDAHFGKMPSTIVKHAEEILEKREQSKLATNQNQNSVTDIANNNPHHSEYQSVSEQICNNWPLGVDSKIAAPDEKLLKNVDQRMRIIMNELLSEQISDLKLEIDTKITERDGKLLQNFDEINKLLRSVLQEVNLLKNKD